MTATDDYTKQVHLSASRRVKQASRPSTVIWDVESCAFLPDWVGTTIAFTLSQPDTGGCDVRFRHRQHRLTAQVSYRPGLLPHPHQVLAGWGPARREWPR